MATAKQLAALKKARAARTKNLKKTTTKRKVVAKVRTKTATIKSTSQSYVIQVVTTTGKTGYFKNSLKTLEFDDALSVAFTGSKRVMDNFAALIYAAKPKGIRSIEVIKK